jgi:hypothetical protein
MNKRFQFSLPKVSDALNGIIAVTRHASILNPLTLKERGTTTKAFLH